MRIKTHRDNWSPLVALERAGVRLNRERYQDVAFDLTDRDVVAELLTASAHKSIEVHESAREELEAYGLTVTAAGAIVVLEPADRGDDDEHDPNDDDQDDDAVDQDDGEDTTSEPTESQSRVGGDDGGREARAHNHETGPGADAPASTSGKRRRRARGGRG